MNTWILENQKQLNNKLTKNEKKIISYLKGKKVEIKTNEPYKLSNYKKIGVGFVDIILNGKIAIEVDGKHHRTDEKLFQDDKEKMEKLWNEYNIPTIRIPNEVIDKDFRRLEELLDTLCSMSSFTGKKLNRVKKMIFAKQDWIEVSNWIKYRSNHENRMIRRSFVEWIEETNYTFNGYRKILHKLTNGISGCFWLPENLPLEIKKGDYVKYSYTDKQEKINLKKLYYDGRT